jgi:hypothetical protein
MKFAIVNSRFRHAGQPGTTTPGPPFAMLGLSVRKVSKEWHALSVPFASDEVHHSGWRRIVAALFGTLTTCVHPRTAEMTSSAIALAGFTHEMYRHARSRLPS